MIIALSNFFTVIFGMRGGVEGRLFMLSVITHLG